MSVIKMGLRPGRNASFGKITENRSKLVWMAVTDSNTDDESIVGIYGWSNGILPVPFVHTHPLYPTQLCRSINFSQDSGAPRKWQIEADYSSEPLKTADQTNITDPTQRPPEISWTTAHYRKAIDKDINGKALVNSAGDYFDPPPEKDASYWVANIKKNVPSVPTFILAYTDAINSDSFTIQGMTVNPKVAKLMDINISNVQTEGDYSFVVFEYSLEFHPETWVYRPLDQGFTTFSNFGGRQRIVDESTPPRQVTSPVLLNGEGQTLDNPSTANAVFLEYDILNEQDFGGTLPGLSDLEN